MIIDFSSRSPETHRYSLVRPKLLRKSAGGDELVCERYQRWRYQYWLPFGNIKHLKGIEMYHFYLAQPDNLCHSNRDPLYINPFYFPFYRLSPCTFPTALLASKTKFLHVALTVPDVIRYLEDGHCSSCYGKHVVGSEIVPGTSRRWARFSQLLGVSITVFPPGLFICPLCVGLEHAWESIDAWKSHNLTGKKYNVARKEYNSWLLDRLESLGYERPRLEDLPDSIE
ncbi:uncharacterized protein FFB14_10089 [Fusarium fujikuroi]|nr:uncharacterized protein FFB14_10089 [Fusarium fujikuroi]